MPSKSPIPSPLESQQPAPPTRLWITRWISGNENAARTPWFPAIRGSSQRVALRFPRGGPDGPTRLGYQFVVRTKLQDEDARLGAIDIHDPIHPCCSILQRTIGLAARHLQLGPGNIVGRRALYRDRLCLFAANRDPWICSAMGLFDYHPTSILVMEVLAHYTTRLLFRRDPPTSGARTPTSGLQPAPEFHLERLGCPGAGS